MSEQPDFKLGDHVRSLTSKHTGIITETLEMTAFGSMHGMVKVRYAGYSTWCHPSHLHRESYMGWEL
jgi:hypothetical protein